MNFVKVDGLPVNVRNKKCDMEARLEEFLNMGAKYARVEFNSLEYNSTDSCKGALYHSINHYGLPISVRSINGEVYLIRKDL